MKIALVNPIARNTAGYHTIGSKIPQLGLQVLAAYTPPEHTIDLYDEIFGCDETIPSVIAGGYDLVGITAMTSGATRAYELSAAFRKAGLTTMLGGMHATTCPDEAASHFDSIVIGEADEIWPTILEDAQANRMQARYEVQTLPELNQGYGRAAQHLQPVNGKYDVASLQTSRGCPINCKFCSVTQVNGPRVRRREIDDILDEWNSIRQPFVFITDDNFFGLSSKQAEWSKELLRAIIKHGKRKLWFSQTSINMGDDPEGLKLAYKAGCRSMLVGLESFDEENLQQYAKRLNRENLTNYRKLIKGFHRSGLAVFGAMIVGADGDTQDSVERVIANAINLGVDIIQLTNLTPLPGTQLYDELRDAGRLVADNYPQDWEKYTFAETVFTPKRMTAQQLDEAMFLFRRGVAERRWVFRRTIKSLLNTKSWTTAAFVHGMNKGFDRMAKFQVARDSKRFPHLLKCTPTRFPD